jgi:uncharacterized membrane protein YbaN (DUF454 family)
MNSFLKIAGFILIGIGSIGLFLPFLQGVFLIVLGVYFISRVDKKFEESVIKLFEKGKLKFPKYIKLFERIEEIYKKMVKWGKKEEKTNNTADEPKKEEESKEAV